MNQRVKSYRRISKKNRPIKVKSYTRKKRKRKGRLRIINPRPVFYYMIQDEFGHVLGRTSLTPEEYLLQNKGKNVQIKRAKSFRLIHPSKSKIHASKRLSAIINVRTGSYASDLAFEDQKMANKALDRFKQKRDIPYNSHTLRVVPVKRLGSRSPGQIKRILTSTGDITYLGDRQLTDFMEG